jgi:hypothetical protein
MKRIVSLAGLLMLCACGSVPEVRTSFSANGQSLHSMDLSDPHFYMDDDAGSAGVEVTPSRPAYYPMYRLCTPAC